MNTAAPITEPRTLQEAIVHFSNPDNCIAYLVQRRWPDGVVKCPTCGSEKVSYVPTRRVWQCKTRHAKAQFSIKVGTIMEDSPISLDKWLCAMWMLANCKNGVSSYEIHRDIGVTQKTAWFLLHRIRLAMKIVHNPKYPIGNSPANQVEVDETFIGGKPKNMHAKKRIEMGQDGNKTIVMGMMTRTTREVRAMVAQRQARNTAETDTQACWLGFARLHRSMGRI